MNLKEKRDIKGLWWLPDAPNNQVSGTLIVTIDKISLETIGVLGIDDPISHFVGEIVPQYDVIWGISSDAKEISVFNCYESMSFNPNAPFSVAKYSAQVVAVGKHIRTLDELGNYDVKVYIEELSYWFKPNCLHFNYDKHQYTFSADLNKTHNVTTQIEDGCDLNLQGEVQISQNKTGMRVEIEQMSTLNFLFTKPISMRDAKRNAFIFEQFLSFATLSPVQYDRLILIDKDKKPDPTKNWNIEIYDKRGERTGDPERFWEYLFVYDTIKDSFPSIISKWYEEKDMFPIRAHLIDSVGHRGSFCSTDFLIIVQAVEGYFCRFKKDGLSLTTILEKLREEFSDITIMDMSDLDIECIVDSRHYYSHLLPPGKKPNVVDGHELYNLNHKLRKLLLCCILKFVGFNNGEINTIFSRSHNSYLRMVNGEGREIKDEEPIDLDGEVLSSTQVSEAFPE